MLVVGEPGCGKSAASRRLAKVLWEDSNTGAAMVVPVIVPSSCRRDPDWRWQSLVYSALAHASALAKCSAVGGTVLFLFF